VSTAEAAGAGIVGVEERFGPYGGRFVPEVLMAALDELSSAWPEARDDEGFRGELDRRRSTSPSASRSESDGGST
jgi:tryptophan synthase beta subunit